MFKGASVNIDMECGDVTYGRNEQPSHPPPLPPRVKQVEVVLPDARLLVVVSGTENRIQRHWRTRTRAKRPRRRSLKQRAEVRRNGRLNLSVDTGAAIRIAGARYFVCKGSPPHHSAFLREGFVE